MLHRLELARSWSGGCSSGFALLQNSLVAMDRGLLEHSARQDTRMAARLAEHCPRMGRTDIRYRQEVTLLQRLELARGYYSGSSSGITLMQNSPVGEWAGTYSNIGQAGHQDGRQIGLAFSKDGQN